MHLHCDTFNVFPSVLTIWEFSTFVKFMPQNLIPVREIWTRYVDVEHIKSWVKPFIFISMKFLVPLRTCHNF